MRRFPRRAVVAVLAIVGGYLVARSLELKLPASGPARGGVSTNGVVPSAELAAVDFDGNAVVARVLATLERWPNVAARFRQSLRIGDEPQLGDGEYWQQGVGNQRRTCWQWQTLIAGQQAVFSQIYDKNAYLWTDVRFPGKRTVTRVNVDSLRREFSASSSAAGQGGAGGSAAGNLHELELLARGGLSQTIAELRRAFTFGSPALVVEDGRQLVAVVGRWRDDQLKRQWQSLTPESAGGWPAHLPHHVVLKVGREDFFPYMIEYRRGADAQLIGDVGAANDPLARHEFFEVRWGVVMPDRLFEFTPTEVDWHDVTGRLIERLRPVPPQAPPPLARRDGGWRR